MSKDITQQALEAAQQCIVDFLEAYKRDCAMVVMDLAVQSLRNDALPKIKAALRSRDKEQANEVPNDQR